MKDNFSKQAATYAKFRPSYPTALYDFIFQHTPRFESAWDCGTGNGQVAQALATRFTRVYASDISAGQLAQALFCPMCNMPWRQRKTRVRQMPILTWW